VTSTLQSFCIELKIAAAGWSRFSY